MLREEHIYMSLLQTEGLTKQFGGFTAVDKVNLSVEPNEVHSIIGPNGAGKTTLFNLLAGTLPVTEGSIIFDDTEITDKPEHRRPYIGLSRSYQITNIYDSMTVFENIETAVGLYYLNYYDTLRRLESRDEVTERADELLARLNLGGNRENEAGSLPHGDRRRLEIGMGLASNPEILLLDEPTAGMDPGESVEIVSLIEELANEMAVVLVEHDIEHVMDVSDQISVLERGRVIANGTANEIQSNQNVIDAYLGESAYA
jgi:branched-chain amino acid transport system ATP-binding protein